MAATRINPLSNPKGVKLSCELCAKPAYTQCKDCRVTFYCGKEHQSVDARGIHAKICQLLVPLRIPISVLGSEEERAQREQLTRSRQLHLLQITRTEAHRLLFEGQYDLAIPAALQALRFSMDVSGANSIDLVPSYLLLGKASIGLKQYKQAEGYLSQANWAILKAESCEDTVRAQLHRNFGLLYASQGQYDKALGQLAQDIYYISLSKGPEHISATGGYFQLGTVFQNLGRIEHATGVFDKVVHIWKAALKTPDSHLDVVQMAEAVQMLTFIHAFRTSYMSASTLATEVLYVLAQVYHASSQMDKAKDFASKALHAYEAALGRDHTLSIETRMFLRNLLGELPSIRKPRALTSSRPS
ncbi:hypothetical protein BASA61_010069 [Batrachochytrium salamandrivorans]|nr:hypothetical protein BASA62_007083 [Batrachochytrium salamandrivorans]KAH6579726.1 hypothetical protein BASA61_010069 [Batrachochytrium salamandrivorans]KAH9265156.1 hypothetical protein BASA83_011312 [Batrachochytrium salamandrivorans]